MEIKHKVLIKQGRVTQKKTEVEKYPFLLKKSHISRTLTFGNKVGCTCMVTCLGLLAGNGHETFGTSSTDYSALSYRSCLAG